MSEKQVPELTISDECKYCGEDEPEWSSYAKCWIHRRPSLDKRCTRKVIGPVGEPVASPQATAFSVNNSLERDRFPMGQQWNAKATAQPAAGTTPFGESRTSLREKAHEPTSEFDRNCIPDLSEGTTPQAERPMCASPEHVRDNAFHSDGGLCPFATEARAVAPVETPDEQDCTCANVNTDMPCSVHTVETRLTAEQLTTEANDLLRRLSREVFEDGINIEQLPHAVDLVISFAEEAFKKFAEAFHDKSEAGLREKIKRLQQAHERIGDILLPLVDTPDGTSVGCAENAAKELTKLRAKLADITKALENMTPGGSEFHDSPNNCLAFIKDRMATVVSQVKARRATEAEAAALRKVLHDNKVLY